MIPLLVDWVEVDTGGCRVPGVAHAVLERDAQVVNWSLHLLVSRPISEAAGTRKSPTFSTPGSAQSRRILSIEASQIMATSSILGGERAPITPKGTDTESLGPSNSSDSGSDVSGVNEAAAEGGLETPTNADILPDRVGVLPDAAAEVEGSVDDPEALTTQDLADEIAADSEGEGEEADDQGSGQR